MKKAELLRRLGEKFHRVEAAKLQQTYGNLKWYLVKVYDLVNAALRDANIAFYVEDEGQTTETAYWSPSEPKLEVVVGFAQELSVYISQKMAEGVLKAVFVKDIDSQNETAIVRGVKQTLLDGLREFSFLIRRDADGNLQLKRMS